jgi:uncharacterized protein (TIGR00269 family)
MATGSGSTGRRAAARRCSICGAPAVAYLPYARLALCEKHFVDYIDRKVGRVLRRVGALRRGSRIVAAVSGGKDSATMLASLAKHARENGVEVIGVHIVLGFGPYSERSRQAAEEACRKLNVPCLVVSVEELLGVGVYELARRSRRPVCSVCGIVKRYILNAVAVEAGADYVALGHNGDDIIAYAMKSFLNQDLGYIAKLGPATKTVPGLAVGRIRPLYEVFEKETLIYALVSGTPFLHEECPYRPVAPIEQRIKEMMNRLEEEHPGIKMSTVKKLASSVPLYERLAGEAEIGRCRHCGLISAGDECSFCRLTRRVLGEPAGPKVREWARSRLAEVLGRGESAAGVGPAGVHVRGDGPTGEARGGEEPPRGDA